MTTLWRLVPRWAGSAEAVVDAYLTMRGKNLRPVGRSAPVVHRLPQVESSLYMRIRPGSVARGGVGKMPRVI